MLSKRQFGSRFSRKEQLWDALIVNMYDVLDMVPALPVEVVRASGGKPEHIVIRRYKDGCVFLDSQGEIGTAPAEWWPAREKDGTIKLAAFLAWMAWGTRGNPPLRTRCGCDADGLCPEHQRALTVSLEALQTAAA